MKSLAAVILFSLYLFGATEACQLLKVPFLVNHFIEHNHKEKSISFIEFLKLHYSDRHASTEDNHKHSKLPFKTVDICCIAGHTTIPVSEISFQIPEYSYITVPYANYQPGDYILTHTGDIFQPPKA